MGVFRCVNSGLAKCPGCSASSLNACFMDIFSDTLSVAKDKKSLIVMYLSTNTARHIPYLQKVIGLDFPEHLETFNKLVLLAE